jgi:hypothetical protein
MIKSTKFLAILVTIMSSQASFASYDLISAIKIVNHYNGSLQFKVKTISRHNSHLPEKFTLNSGEAITGDIVKMGSDARPIQEVYFYVNEIMADGDNDRGLPNAFWGANVSYANGADLAIHKYDNEPYQYGVAYSWINRRANEPYTVVTFCTPDEYKKHHHC